MNLLTGLFLIRNFTQISLRRCVSQRDFITPGYLIHHTLSLPPADMICSAVWVEMLLNTRVSPPHVLALVGSFTSQDNLFILICISVHVCITVFSFLLSFVLFSVIHFLLSFWMSPLVPLFLPANPYDLSFLRCLSHHILLLFLLVYFHCFIRSGMI